MINDEGLKNIANRCAICKSSTPKRIFSEIIFGKEVDYFDCSVCGYVYTESPYWLEEAYSSVINNCDTGIMVRNQTNVGVVLATLTSLKKIGGCVVDCAGGYGILVRLLRDRGIDALWSDPYCKNLLAAGFEHTVEKADLVTAFEAFEHFVDPVAEAEKLFEISPNLLISTTLIKKPAPAQNEWWYYGFDHGQHIGFFRLQTLQFIAKKFGKHVVSDGVGYHFFTEKPISSWLWNLSIRLAHRLPFLYRRNLESKVWKDFEKMSSKT